jgi:hypothetical protein
VADSSLSKEDLARELARKEAIASGPICLLACVEPCLSFQLRRSATAPQQQIFTDEPKSPIKPITVISKPLLAHV